MPEDFTNLWKSQQGDSNKPKASVIGGLQKLLEEKDAQIIQLKDDNNKLKEQINQYIEISSLSEKTITEQQKKIDDLSLKLDEYEVQMSVSGKGKSGLDSFSRQSTVSVSSSDSEQVKQLKMQVRSLEDKLYVFSTLPDRIASLEESKSKDLALIEEYEEREKSLRQKIKALSDSNSSANQLQDMEDQIKSLRDTNKKLQSRLNDMENQAISPGAIRTSSGSGSSASDVLDWKQKFESAKSEYEKTINALRNAESELTVLRRRMVDIESEKIKENAKSEMGIDQIELKNELANVKSELASAKSKLLDITMERDSLRGKVDLDQISSLKIEKEAAQKEIGDLKEKLKTSDIQYEELLNKFQSKSDKGAIASEVEKLADNLRREQDKVKAADTEINQLKSKINELEKKASEAPKVPPAPKLPPAGGMAASGSLQGLVDELKMKVERQNKTIGKLNEENNELRGKLTNVALPSAPSAPVVSKDNSAEIKQLKEQIETLKSEKMSLEEKIKQAPAPAAAPATQGQDNLLTLINDLQDKVNKLKKENLKLKDELGKK